MILCWGVHYLDRSDRQYKNRDLYLDTESLDAPTRAAIEFVLETETHKSDREIVKYRNLFTEDNSDGAAQKWLEGGTSTRMFGIPDYVEDESGRRLSPREEARILTGSPTAILAPRGASKRDIEFIIAEPKDIPIADINLSHDVCRTIGYFVRDFDEMQASAFRKDGPGTITSTGNGDYGLQTAVSDDEIRSFITIFRRLYMVNEPANFQAAVRVFGESIGDNPYVCWIKGIAYEYERDLDRVVDVCPFAQELKITCSRKRLIDVFLYTQYAHQPDERRQRQFLECLNEVQGERGFLTWVFLSELWKTSLQIGNAGRVIAGWFRKYCEYHQVANCVLPSLAVEIPGIGAQEKTADRAARIMREKTEDLAMTIWKQNGCPEGGAVQFLPEAEQQLRSALQ